MGCRRRRAISGLDSAGFFEVAELNIPVGFRQEEIRQNPKIWYPAAASRTTYCGFQSLRRPTTCEQAAAICEQAAKSLLAAKMRRCPRAAALPARQLRLSLTGGTGPV